MNNKSKQQNNNAEYKRRVHNSKFLSLVLRHKPQAAGITLDAEGWANLIDLLEGCRNNGHPISLPELVQVVGQNDKKRFELDIDNNRIRAVQGHSVEVDLKYEPTQPPEFLFHGTIGDYLDSILEQGLLKRRRNHVHLSYDIETARKVGGRRGIPVILCVWADLMRIDGYEFYQASNGVWLTDHVPAKYIRVVPE
jgi:putative RNA 2'-phosphotransferase